MWRVRISSQVASSPKRFRETSKHHYVQLMLIIYGVPRSIDMLADDLLKVFGECLAIRGNNDRNNSNDDARGTFLQGKQLSLKLAKVIFSDMLEREDKTVFIKLSNALCMQARCVLLFAIKAVLLLNMLYFCSIELNCEMREIATKYTDRIAYNIGGKVLTTTHLASIM